jgi:putative sterol carrier protein
MAGDAERFFEGLDGHASDPLLHEQMSGTIRFDLDHDGEIRSWWVAFAEGTIVVTRGPGEANCTLRAPEELFERVIRGEANPLTAVMRGEIEVEGDPELLLRFQRLLPSQGARADVYGGAR